MRRLLAVLLLLVLLAGGGVAWLAQHWSAPGPAAGDTTLVIERGLGSEQIAARLEQAGVIDSALVFLAVSTAIGGRGFQAGEYVVPARATMAEIAWMMRQGMTLVRRLTVPEGLTSVEVIALLAAEPHLDGDVPAPPPEGAILPETYHFAHGDRRSAVLDRMLAARRQVLAELWQGRAPNLPLATPEEALVLASIVEKETGVAAERARVAGVFINRLRLGMPLQSDPTVAYGITQGQRPLGRPLTTADLQAPTAYNTYTIKALPPAPIANPGRAAIAATLQPEATQDLYFVADGTGGHAFARTLPEHNANVRAWRRIEQQRSQTVP
ncbi:endolytic transglycosylase MltG [Zavarzinia sp. CC-PAN008]|uniref:endolytic transglycosylase MltG n=1 Tax=Zavarzinia sp. CC-PAN008 TaxID=3243332 RepID=UPI003F745D19